MGTAPDPIIPVVSRFVVFSLPRSRSAWLSRLLTYRHWVCGHEEVRNLRSLDDVAMWFAQPSIGTVETAAAPWWRLLPKVAPGAKVAVLRRPIDEIMDSFARAPGVVLDRDLLHAQMVRLDHKLDQIAARVPDVLSTSFAELDTEAGCKAIFEHCLGMPHDHEHWAQLAPINMQIDLRALMRHFVAFRPCYEKLAAQAKNKILASFALGEPRDLEGISFQTEFIEAWERDAQHLFRNHCTLVGEHPAEWAAKNWPLLRAMYDVGAMQIMTARSNGRMFGYLMTLIAPSMTREQRISATNTTFFAADQFPGLGMAIQREAIRSLKARGVHEVFFETGTRGSGPKLGAMYRRLGAVEHGQMYRLQLEGC